MPSSVASHSHRSTTKVSHKPFKSRKSTKGAIKEITKGLGVLSFKEYFTDSFQAKSPI